MLWLACRHHVAEIMAKECWYELFEEDLGPDNGLFVQLEESWSDLNMSSDVPTMKLNNISRHLVNMKDEAIDFYNQFLASPSRTSTSMPRDDYCEIAKTSLVILGGKLPAGREMFWCKPGATHKARFMAFGIYSNKMFSFSDQLNYDNEIKAALRRFTSPTF